MSVAFDRRFDRGSTMDRPVPVLRLVLLAVTVLVVHALIYRRLRIAGVGPETFIVLTVVGGLELGVAGGAALGLLAGVGADLCTTAPMGIWALVLGLLGLVMGVLRERAFADSLRRPPFGFVWLGTIGAIALDRAFAFVIDDAPFPEAIRIAWIVLIAPLWGVVLTYPVRALVQLVMGKGR